MALLEIRAVTRRFGDFVAVDNVSLDVQAGEFFTLVGPSGCGKTTLLRMIAGFDQPDAGQIVLEGKNLEGTPPEARNVHTVFQSYALFPHMTVEQNIAFPLRMAKAGDAQIKPRVAEALEDVRLTDKGKRYPHELSGGQRQRVALARALVNRPKLLLLDEPLAALDAKLKEQMQLELIELQREVGVTFIYVTHDQGEALALSHRIAVMNHGVIEQLDEPARVYGFPKNRFVADFIGTCNLWEGTVTSVGEREFALELDGIGPARAIVNATTNAAPQPGQRGCLTLRPEKLRIAADLDPLPEENSATGKVHDFLYLGDVTIYIVDLEKGARIEAMLPNAAPGRTRFFEVGDAVEIAWCVDAGHFIDA
jgi:spermidine/putrescine transport system ATP-binding protein